MNILPAGFPCDYLVEHGDWCEALYKVADYHWLSISSWREISPWDFSDRLSTGSMRRERSEISRESRRVWTHLALLDMFLIVIEPGEKKQPEIA